MGTCCIHQRFTLQPAERLKSRKQIETLFQNGKAFSVTSLRVIYLVAPGGLPEISPVRIGFSVPKKRIRKAVHRNRLKRLLREAWRTQKHALYRHIPGACQLHCFFIYTGRPSFTYTEAEAAVKKAAARLQELIPGE